MEASEPLSKLIERRLSRRSLLKGAAGSLPLLVAAGPRLGDESRPEQGGLGFRSIPLSQADSVVVPEGYRARVVLGWGDPIFPKLEPFDVKKLSAATQARRFGFNCDFIAWMPLHPGADDRGLLCVNHEYTDPRMMHPGYDPKHPTSEQVAIEWAAQGFSVVEVRKTKTGWTPVLESRFNRRFTASTPMGVSGPAAGHPMLRTSKDPKGERILGTLGNCAGGKTPWGTVLTCEENVDWYFANSGKLEGVAKEQAWEAKAEASPQQWELYDSRFDLAREPNEVNRFGWVVEIDPFDPDSTPMKRTALGRFKHEGATCGLADDGRVVVYLGDDTRFEFIYKFVSSGRYDPTRPRANKKLLDEGTLYVARFSEDGGGRWMPMIPEGPLAGWSQAEILIRARQAARLLGATPMDRPEDIEVNPVNHRVYVALTNNNRRKDGDGAANPRGNNVHGHVLEMDENQGDLGATRFTWNPFLLCGDPKADHGAFYGGMDPELVSPLSCPDNLCYDGQGNLWIATDGQDGNFAGNDSVYAVPVAGPERGLTRRFLTGPRKCEICGPEMSPSGDTLFLSIQHPGEGGTLAKPTSRWPEGEGGIARPSVIAVTRDDGGVIGR